LPGKDRRRRPIEVPGARMLTGVLAKLERTLVPLD
jgi:hypothetical protein